MHHFGQPALNGTQRWDADWARGDGPAGLRHQRRECRLLPALPASHPRCVALATPWGEPGAAILVSNVSFLSALCCCAPSSPRGRFPEVARRSVLLLACFPWTLASSLFQYSGRLPRVFATRVLEVYRRGRWGLGSFWRRDCNPHQGSRDSAHPFLPCSGVAEQGLRIVARVSSPRSRPCSQSGHMAALGLFSLDNQCAHGRPKKRGCDRQRSLSSPS